MAIRIRKIGNAYIALCAARFPEREGDIYLTDAQHSAISDKIASDFEQMGFAKDIPKNSDREALIETMLKVKEEM